MADWTNIFLTGDPLQKSVIKKKIGKNMNSSENSSVRDYPIFVFCLSSLTMLNKKRYLLSGCRSGSRLDPNSMTLMLILGFEVRIPEADLGRGRHLVRLPKIEKTGIHFFILFFSLHMPRYRGRIRSQKQSCIIQYWLRFLHETIMQLRPPPPPPFGQYNKTNLKMIHFFI
jgi:hypothetical protein